MSRSNNDIQHNLLMSSPLPSPVNLEDYSAAATLVPFPSPVPLLRGPIKAGPSDAPSSGPYLLAFKSPRAWAAAYKDCEAQIIAQCEAGSRIGCSISASSKCKPPWWKTLLGGEQVDFSARERCEEREMEACFATARAKCGDFAKHKCGPAFGDARIEASNWDPKMVDWKDVSRLISGVLNATEKRYGFGFGRVDKSWGEFKIKYEVTNVRGSDLLSSDDVNIDDYLKRIR